MYLMPRFLDHELADNGIFESVQMSKRDLKHEQVIPGGDDEEIFAVTYRCFDGDKDLKVIYGDQINRPGNQLIVELNLPESVAKKMFKAMKDDPAFARRAAKELTISQLGFSEEDWADNEVDNRDFVAPPYEDIDSYSGKGTSKMLFLDQESISRESWGEKDDDNVAVVEFRTN